MTRQRTLIALAGALGLATAAVVDLYRRVNSASQVEIDAEVSHTVAGLATLPPDMTEGAAVIYVVRHEQPPSTAVPWFWHVAATCPDCTHDEDCTPQPALGQAVHEVTGYASSKRGARARAAEAFAELTGMETEP